MVSYGREIPRKTQPKIYMRENKVQKPGRYIRFTPDLDAWLENQARTEGFRSLAEYVKHLAQQARAQAEAKQPEKDDHLHSSRRKITEPIAGIAHRTEKQGRRPRFVRVRNLERFQHFNRSNPPWVKLYASLIDNYDFQQLPDATRFHAMALIVLASRTGNFLPSDPQWLGSRIGARTSIDIKALLRCGFLEPARKGEKKSDKDAKKGDRNLQKACREAVENGINDCKQRAESIASDRDRDRGRAETHNNTPPASAVGTDGLVVSCASRFSLAECLAFAQHKKAKGEPVVNPVGLAHWMQQTGRCDAEIGAFLHPAPKRDISRCPDCYGTGMQSVAGKGARRCEHQGLDASETPAPLL